MKGAGELFEKVYVELVIIIYLMLDEKLTHKLLY